MTIPKIESVGFCAHYSTQGDWAFDYALGLCRRHNLRLNVFHFLFDPYDPSCDFIRGLSNEQVERVAVDCERDLRMYYDEKAGDYLDVGFRLCYDDSWRELHRCLCIHEFQLLVLGCVSEKTHFAGRTIEEFAASFVCPTVLVGPESQQRFRLNSQAALLADRLGLEKVGWGKIGSDLSACS